MQQPGRKYSAGNKYRYGFNGKENDNEVKGEGNTIDFDARVYDSRIGRWFSLDPLGGKFPNETGYGFVSNSPLLFMDPNGEEKIVTITTLNKDGSKTVLKVTDKNYFYYHTVKGSFKTAYQDRDHKESISINFIIDNRGDKSLVTRSIYAYDIDDNYTFTEKIQDKLRITLKDSPRKYGWTMNGGGDGVSPAAQLEWDSNLPKAEYSDHLGSITGLLDVVGNFREFEPLSKDGDQFKEEMSDVIELFKEKRLIKSNVQFEVGSLKLLDNLADGLGAMEKALEGTQSILHMSNLPNPRVTFCRTCDDGNWLKDGNGFPTFVRSSDKAGDTTDVHSEKPSVKTKEN